MLIPTNEMVKEAVASAKEGVKKRRKVVAATEAEPEQDLYRVSGIERKNDVMPHM